MKAKDYYIQMASIQERIANEIKSKVKECGPYTWDGAKDGKYGPVVLFEDDDTTDVLDVRHIYIDEVGDVILMGCGRSGNVHENVYLGHVALDSLPSILDRIENYK